MSNFKTKFETKSSRVKGIAFHPARPWILAALHSGVIQLWDYRIKTLLDKFEEHDGPVRGVAFHNSQPLFASGGDDYKIKLWNIKQRRCLFTLLGHLDYIRTVQFHHESPWLISASDDQTIRIWNWQSRSCIAVLTGHNHYVMSAQFHPSDDLAVSASLDQTVRVWDLSGLRSKGNSNRGGGLSALSSALSGTGSGSGPSLSSLSAALSQSVRSSSSSNPYGSVGGGGGGGGFGRSDGASASLQDDLFGNTDVVVKYVLEGHDRGLNWAAFHSELPLIISGADDRQLKLWRYSESKAWEVDTFRGHFHNVCACLFHPRADLVLSAGEDKTIRVWDLAKRSAVHTFRREHDRFWVLSAHPEIDLFAAGHDSGLIVFKLHRERPAFTVHKSNQLFYVKDSFVRCHDFQSGKDAPILALRRRVHTAPPARSLCYSPQDRALLLCYDGESNMSGSGSLSGSPGGGNGGGSGGGYELFVIPRADRSSAASGGVPDEVEARRGSGTCAVFIGRRRFAVLRGADIVIKNTKNEEVKTITPPSPADAIFPGPPGTLLLRCGDAIVLFDLQQRRVLADLATPATKFVLWSSDAQTPMAALVGKNSVTITTRKLEPLCTVQETLRVKSGVWDERGIFIYTTLNHLKYCLPNGDSGIIRTLEVPVYLTAVKETQVHCLDRQGKKRIITVDNTEFVFKDALIRRKYDVVLRMVREANLIGQSIIAYLQRKGFPEVALHFVRDPTTRFALALECGAIDAALEAAQTLDAPECWDQLAQAALKLGNLHVVEMAYQRTRNFERLSFLYLITGNTAKLRKMLKIADMRGDANGRFHNALYLGDVADRVDLLQQVGQTGLAYAAAKTHGLTERAGELSDALLAGARQQQKQQRVALLQQRAAAAAAEHPDDEEAAAAAAAAVMEAGAADAADVDPADVLPRVPGGRGDCLRPPVPVLRAGATEGDDGNWPLLTVSKGYFKGGGLDETAKFGAAAQDDDELAAAESAWGVEAGGGDGDDDDLGLGLDDGLDEDALGGDGGEGDAWGLEGLDDADELGGGDKKAAAAAAGGGWDGDDLGDELDIPLDDDEVGDAGDGAGERAGGAGYWVAPQPGPGAQDTWTRASSLAADHAAAGSFDSMASLLHAQIGAVALAPLKPVVVALVQGAHCSLPGLTGCPSRVTVTTRAAGPGARGAQARWGLPRLAASQGLPALIERLRDAYRATTEGKFGPAQALFQSILQTAPLLVVADRTELNEVRELIGLCREYVVGLQLELARKELAASGAGGDTAARQCELAAYFTHCSLQSVHLMLSLRAAMTSMFKLKNYKTAAVFARRLLELAPKPAIGAQARKVVKYADSHNADAVELDYDERNPFVVCAGSHKPIYKGTEHVACPLCEAQYTPQHKGQVCRVCEVSAVGKECGGLQLLEDAGAQAAEKRRGRRLQ